VIRQWKDKSASMHDKLLGMYVVMYRVVFETPSCFAVMNNSIFTHEFNGFEIDFALLSQTQRKALLAVLDVKNYHISYCPFLDNISMTGFPRDPDEADWCDTQRFFAIFVDMELSSAPSYEGGLLRADTMSVVLQDMLVSSTRMAPSHARYLQCVLEAIDIVAAAGQPAEGALLTLLGYPAGEQPSYTTATVTSV
jgi:hypothetical protein